MGADPGVKLFNGRPTGGKFQAETFQQRMDRSLRDAVGKYHRNRHLFTMSGERVSSDVAV